MGWVQHSQSKAQVKKESQTFNLMFKRKKLNNLSKDPSLESLKELISLRQCLRISKELDLKIYKKSKKQMQWIVLIGLDDPQRKYLRRNHSKCQL